MNITKLVASLQKAANTSTTSAELANLSRAIKGLNVGTVQTVANTASLPAMLPTNGNLYYVESDEDLYYNVGGTWNRFYVESFNIYGWGRNDHGQLGDGTTTSRSSPVSVVGGIINWSKITNGTYFSLGLTTSGILYAWGRNNYGQLGDNTITNKSSPVTVVGGITNWSQIEAGRVSLGVTSSGLAYAWGYNGYGLLGDNTRSHRSSPVLIAGGITNWSQVSSGADHSLALRSTGILYAWGRGARGQLGNADVVNYSSPVTVVGGITTWTQISAGEFFNLGLTSTGVAYTWGYNAHGQLGDGTTTNKSIPVTVVGGITTWAQLSAGSRNSIARTSAGVAYAWGYNTDGQLGTNNTSSYSSPVTVVGGITNWSQVSTGGSGFRANCLGLTATGAVYGWGYNARGQVGDNTTSNRSSPVTIVGGLTGWLQVSVAPIHSSLALQTSIT